MTGYGRRGTSPRRAGRGSTTVVPVKSRAAASRASTRRTPARAAAAALVVATSVLVAAPGALASGDTDLFRENGPGLSITETLGLYVLAPAALFVLIALAVLGPSMGRGARHKTGTSLDAGPVWVDPAGAAAKVRAPSASSSDVSEAPHQGGASARW